MLVFVCKAHGEYKKRSFLSFCCAFSLSLYFAISIQKIWFTKRIGTKTAPAPAPAAEELEVRCIGAQMETKLSHRILFCSFWNWFCFVCLSLVFAVVGTFVRNQFCNGCAFVCGSAVCRKKESNNKQASERASESLIRMKMWRWQRRWGIRVFTAVSRAYILPFSLICWRYGRDKRTREGEREWEEKIHRYIAYSLLIVCVCVCVNIFSIYAPSFCFRFPLVDAFLTLSLFQLSSISAYALAKLVMWIGLVWFCNSFAFSLPQCIRLYKYMYIFMCAGVGCGMWVWMCVCSFFIIGDSIKHLTYVNACGWVSFLQSILWN